MEEIAASFREAMSRVSAPVTIITTMVDGVPHGTTVSAFASLSVHPPMVLLALDNRGALVGRVRETGRLMVNVLAEGQAATAIRFATPGLPDRFEGVAWSEDHGLPKLTEAAAWLRCENVVLEPGGDHTVLLATATSAESTDRGGLTYYRRQFGSADRAIELQSPR